MVKKTKYAAGIEIESAFGRTDYMYVYEVAPWAYDAINDWIKVSIQGVLPIDITDDWARELGQIDLARYLGAACGLLNPVHVGITVAGAIVDPRQIRALTAADIVSAAQSGVWSVGRTWTLTALDIVSAAQSGVWSVGRTWALAVATDAVAAQVSNWPALYAMNLTQYLSAACGLLNPIHVGITVAGAIVDPRSIRALTAADVVTADSLTKWGGTGLTGHDITDHITNIDVLLSTRARLQPWYQPNFNRIVNSYTGWGLAPHATTQRFSYTVPANRIAKITHAFQFIIRVTAAAALGWVQDIINVAGVFYTYFYHYDNTVGSHVWVNEGEGSVLKAGDQIVGTTGDGSTGGTVTHSLRCDCMEFDA